MSQRNPMNDRYQTDEHCGQNPQKRRVAQSRRPRPLQRCACSRRRSPRKRDSSAAEAVATSRASRPRSLSVRSSAELNRQVLPPADSRIPADAQAVVGPHHRSYRLRRRHVRRPAASTYASGATCCWPSPTCWHRRPHCCVDSMKIRKLRRIYQDQMEATRARTSAPWKRRSVRPRKPSSAPPRKLPRASLPRKKSPRSAACSEAAFGLSKAEKEKAAKGSSDEPADQSETSAREDRFN